MSDRDEGTDTNVAPPTPPWRRGPEMLVSREGISRGCVRLNPSAEPAASSPGAEGAAGTPGQEQRTLTRALPCPATGQQQPPEVWHWWEHVVVQRGGT